MDQSGNNHLLLRASQPAPPVYNGHQLTAAERMRELLARTVHDHIVEERSVASALQDIRRRLDALDYPGATGTAATMAALAPPGATGPAATMDGLAATIDGLAATIGTLDSKLAARLERLDERLDDQ